MHKAQGVYPLHQVIGPNPPVKEAKDNGVPNISDSALIAAGSVVVGPVTVDDDAFIGFHSIVRADASYAYYIGKKTNIQDFVLIHCHPGEYVTIGKQRKGVHIEDEVSILHHAAAHGPLFIGKNTFIGQHVSIYGAVIGRSCVVMHGAVITNRVKIADGRFVEPGLTVADQDIADKLPEVAEEFKSLNPTIVDYYYRLSKSYAEHTPLVF